VSENKFKEMKNNMEKYKGETCLNYLNGEETETIEAICYQNDCPALTGERVKDLFRKLKEANSNSDALEACVLSRFEK
jgi:hypothetical protein